MLALNGFSCRALWKTVGCGSTKARDKNDGGLIRFVHMLVPLRKVPSVSPAALHSACAQRSWVAGVHWHPLTKVHKGRPSPPVEVTFINTVGIPCNSPLDDGRESVRLVSVSISYYTK